MAWRSSGNSNEKLVRKMKRFGIIRTETVEQAFLAVDRLHFVPPGNETVAHADRPLKEGNIHLSAPHMYGSVLEALDFRPNSSQSFLNLGSGSGYLSCMAAHIIGPKGRHVGVEIHNDVVEHSERAIARWKDLAGSTATIEIIHGNALEIDPSQGEARLGFDRIYTGAALEPRDLHKIVNLLNEGGIFVGPVSDELIKVVRVGANGSVHNPMHPSPPRNIRGRAPMLPAEYSQQIISAVRFSELLTEPVVPTIIPSTIWNPQVHKSFPHSFQVATKEIIMCSRAARVQAPQVLVKETLNAASLLTESLWLEILSYTHRNWFEKNDTEELHLRRRLAEEQIKAEEAIRAKNSAEERLRLVERERDVYRVLALRWQGRLQNNGQNRDVNEVVDSTISDFDSDPLLFQVDGIRSLLQRLQNDHSSEDDDETFEDAESDNEDEHMEDIDLENNSASEDTRPSLDDTSASEETQPSVSLSPRVLRHQSRKVSIADGDI